MTPERWERINELFEAALEREPAERRSFLDEACGADGSLRAEVESLLVAHENAGSFIERPAVRLADGVPAAEGGFAPGHNLGPYEIVAPLGAGGMGVVYRARDPRLGRDVAVKVLTRADARDPERLRRFQNEARAVSALSHPNIVTVYDVGEAEGLPFFAMELVEGRTLRKVLAEAPLPLARALQIASQVAEGLAAAHARGVVHRDLKPENVMLAGDRVAKVLDFGLAKLQEAGLKGDLVTQPGAVLGTAAYMSPEQARGEPADFRSDQFALGAILFEMLEGRRAFERPTPVETLAAIVRDDLAPLTALPPALAWILERCLAKDPEERYGSTRDLARDLARLAQQVSAGRLEAGLPPHRPRLRERPWFALAVVILAVAGGVCLGALWRRSPAEPPALRHLTDAANDSSLAASPDGRTIAFVSSRDGGRRIWVKQRSTGTEAALTAGPADGDPRFSPDGASVFFVRAGEASPSLYRVNVLGGEARRVLEDVLHADLSPDSKRLAFVRFARERGASGYLLGVAESDGSAPRIVERLDALSVRAPRWSPDSRRLAVAHAHGGTLVWSLLVLDPQTGERRVVAPARSIGILSAPVWSPAGREVLYSQADLVERGSSGRLLLQDLASGSSRTLLHVLSLGSSVEVLGRGSVAFTVEPVRGNLVEMPLAGGGERRWLTRGDSDDRQACYSPDGARIVFSSNRDGQLDLWDVETRTGRLRRLTESASEDWDPHVTSDDRLVWSSKRTGNFEVWIAESDGSAPRQVTRDGVDAENPTSTPDASWIVYASHNPAHRGLWKVRPDGSGATALAAGMFGLPEVSPDGSLLLYGAFTPPTTRLRVLRLADGEAVPFEIVLSRVLARTESGYIRGRARWMPDGRGIAFVSVDEAGRSGIFVQDFVPGQDTTATRRRLAGFEPDRVTESFGIAPDGTRLTLTLRERSASIVLAQGLEGVDR